VTNYLNLGGGIGPPPLQAGPCLKTSTGGFLDSRSSPGQCMFNFYLELLLKSGAKLMLFRVIAKPVKILQGSCS